MNILRLGSVGPDVIAWQTVLGLPTTGVYDPVVEEATIVWQRAHGLSTDGVVGPLTWESADVAFPSSIVPIQGMDVSAMQGGSIPWLAERHRGTEFVYLRCQVGNNALRDVQFSENVRLAMLAQFFCGAYFFPFPLPHLDPVAQADMFNIASMVSGHCLGSFIGELPPAYDLEWPPPEDWAKRGCTADQIVDWSLVCLECMTINSGGILPIIYSYPYFLQAISKAKNFAKLLKYKLWIAGGAAYVNGDGHIPNLIKEQPPKVAGWGGAWTFWQHDGNGGRRLTHGVDADFNVFRSSRAELERLCQQPRDDAPDTLPDLSLILQATSNLIVEDGIHAFRQERADQILTQGI